MTSRPWFQTLYLMPLLVAATFSVGCVDCRNLKTWQGADRGSPTNTLMSLRYRLCTEDWAAAAQAVVTNSEFSASRPVSPIDRGFWIVPSPIPGGGEFTYPLGPEDAIGAERVVGTNPDRVEVLIYHKLRLEKDPRPRALVLERSGAEWRIASYRNW